MHDRLIQARRSKGGRHRGTHQRGTALVEFALVVPMLLVLLFGIIEWGRALQAMALVTNASREGARRASVGDTDTQVQDAVSTYLQSSGLRPGQLATRITRSTVAGRPQIDVTLTYALDLLLPTMQLVPNPFPLTGTTVMRVE